MWTKDKIAKSGYYWIWDGLSKTGAVQYLLVDNHNFSFAGYHWDKPLEQPSLEELIKGEKK